MHALIYFKGAGLGARKANRPPPAGSSLCTLAVPQLTSIILHPKESGTLNFWLGGYGVKKMNMENIAGKNPHFKTELSSPVLRALIISLNRGRHHQGPFLQRGFRSLTPGRGTGSPWLHPRFESESLEMRLGICPANKLSR